VSGFYTAEEAQQIFNAANDAYAREDHAAAEAGYRKLLERGYGGPDVLYNLGTTELAAGKLGEAVLHLEQARQASGGDNDIETNLEVARSRQVDQVIGARGGDTFAQRLAFASSEKLATSMFLVCWALAFLLLILRRRWRKTVLAVAAGALLVIAAVSGGLTAAHAYVEKNIEEAVVIAPALQARELPRQGAKVTFEVHAGLKVRVLERSGAYARIQLPNGLQGWANVEGMGEL
jgi:tetratricopeptide (TPR) repeat protein